MGRIRTVRGLPSLVQELIEEGFVGRAGPVTEPVHDPMELPGLHIAGTTALGHVKNKQYRLVFKVRSKCVFCPILENPGT